MEKQVHSDNAFDQSISSAKIHQGAERRCGRQATSQHYLVAAEGRAADSSAGAAPAARWFGNRDLDRIAGGNVKSVQPGGCESRKCGAWWKASSDSRQHQLRAFFQSGPVVDACSKASKRRSAQLSPRDTNAVGIRRLEWSGPKGRGHSVWHVVRVANPASQGNGGG